VKEPEQQPSKRRQTVFNVASGEVTTGPPTSRASAPRRHTAVAAVLGGDLHSRLTAGGAKGEVDVEIILRSAEKLCTVYAPPGAPEQIQQFRSRYGHDRNTLAYYEAKVSDQAQALERMNKDHWMDEDEEAEAEEEGDDTDIITEDDLHYEEQEVRELDKKKRELQERLRNMEKDLGGLMDISR
jgi:hypothetical protein